MAVVADGAGSAKHGEIGATTGATAALGELRRGLDGLGSNRDTTAVRAIVEATLEAARRTITAEAAARQVAVGDLATTLAVCAAGPELVAVAQVGDGAVVVREASGELRSPNPPPAST
jgi:serine/threonine protein phosphatase PrpC